MSLDQYNIFNRSDVIAEGWYWLLPSKALQKRKARAVNILGYELVVFRGDDGNIAALDAYCPHMGANLSQGRVEGNQLRCFFHNWRFDNQGHCTDIPCLKTSPPNKIETKAWTINEKHGLIWVWLGKSLPTEDIPHPPELEGLKYEYSLVRHFFNSCHPNVVMVNAIDEQHFWTVHRLPGHILKLTPKPLSTSHIQFCNEGSMPTGHFLGKLLNRFYKKYLTYNLDYWYGSNGIVCFGPDFLHLYVMFAMRMTKTGKTEGYTIAFTKKRKGILNIFNCFILLFIKIAVRYFGFGDNKIFETIRFAFSTPIPADRTVIGFIRHLERQQKFPKGPQQF